jgi:hypothetical protein
MGQFRKFFNDAALKEVHLQGMLFTWSNERVHPTLERLDRVFISAEWDCLFPHYDERCLPTLCSDHAPLLLRTEANIRQKRQFLFCAFWPKVLGFCEMTVHTWHCLLQSASPFKLQSWSDKVVGNIRLQLAVAKEVLLRLEAAQHTRTLGEHEESLRRWIKLKTVGLASLQRSIAMQESRPLWLREGDASMKFFHAHANIRRQQKHISSLVVDGNEVHTEEAMAQVIHSYFDTLMGTPPTRSNGINLRFLDLPQVEAAGMSSHFTEDEVWKVIKELPPDKAPISDGFTTRFLQVAWEIIRHDLMAALDAFWWNDIRNLHATNKALMILLLKTSDVEVVQDYRPISLIHLVGKLISKILATRLVPKIGHLVHGTQCTFIKGRSIHENFKFVHTL